MCIEIHYLYPSCSCLARVGKYTCYTARTSSPTTSTSSSATNAAKSTSNPSSEAGAPRISFSTDNANSMPEITITSSSGATHLFAQLKEYPLSTFTTAPLFLSPSKNNLAKYGHNGKGAEFTIRTLLSRRVEDISQIDHLGTCRFNAQCENFKIMEQVMRTGMHACEGCWQKIEREELDREQIERESAQRETREGKRVREMVEGDMRAIRQRVDASIETLLGKDDSAGNQKSRGGFPHMDEIERELRDIQRYAEGGEDSEEGRLSWESFDDDEEMELLIAAAGLKGPDSSLGRRRRNSQ